jgi:exodeoxyribonuclease-3
MIRLVSYNVNGIRAALNKGLTDWLEENKPDFFCVQETKASEDQVETSLFEDLGYRHYWFSAQKKGYSGVMVLSKPVPDKVVYGMGMEKYDSEGRVIRLDYGDITLLNVYIPSGTTGGPRQDYKMEFLEDFLQYLNKLREERPNLIITGDFNICHKPIDINHPERHKKSSGFLPEERAWMDRFEANGYFDSFRKFNKEPEKYTWWSYRANSRAKNLGWRIDYFWLSKPLEDRIIKSRIHKEAYHSDHCPIEISIRE